MYKYKDDIQVNPLAGVETYPILAGQAAAPQVVGCLVCVRVGALPGLRTTRAGWGRLATQGRVFQAARAPKLKLWTGPGLKT